MFTLKDLGTKEDEDGSVGGKRVGAGIVLVVVVMLLGLGAFLYTPLHQLVTPDSIQTGQKTLALVDPAVGSGEDNSHLLATFGGYVVEGFNNCHDFDTTLVWGQRFDVYIIDEFALPSGGEDCINTLQRYHPEAIAVICLFDTYNSQVRFKTSCETEGYTVIKRKEAYVVNNHRMLIVDEIRRLLP